MHIGTDARDKVKKAYNQSIQDSSLSRIPYASRARSLFLTYIVVFLIQHRRGPWMVSTPTSSATHASRSHATQQTINLRASSTTLG
ncbi:hypothetical protein PC9H_005836 [Pleurotus ostreatus]|uniref:Uncharacterized protein n=1 Tax=Pleurotus ostreatus TaxID=5322 RepID=A0A8H6ZZU7_PLEOS|nr:uncharacterized protein PC9H_005836 [Pleurotus ostreatus]KAF7430136.1 hypothetical protein PC9H_005836 [Pleurotus ostreatus]